ncbi:hypothetical protein ACWKSP_13720 [Micromonosporaceae bacterium Da 78-11]
MTNLLIPADAVPGLRIPELAVTTGGPDVVWCDRTWGRWRWSRQRVRLPYDPASAARLRKGAWLLRLDVVVMPTYVVVGVLWLSDVLPAGWGLGAIAGRSALTVLEGWWTAKPDPTRTGRGDLYLPDLPAAVAERWIEANPGVRAVDRIPVHRRFRPRVYVLSALGCVLAAAGLVAPLAAAPDLVIVWLFLMVVLAGCAVGLLYRALPTGYIRFDRNPT